MNIRVAERRLKSIQPRQPIQPELRSWMGSAHAPRAVFRARAENLERTKKFRVLGKHSRAQRLDAGRVQPHPRAGVLPLLRSSGSTVAP